MKIKILLLAGFFAAACGTSASAMRVPNQDHLSSILQYPGAPKPVYNDPHSPYAMNYAEEAVSNLGFRDGHMDVFSTKSSSSYMPSFSGGIGSDGAMFRLKWHPGE
jgi:hypothetical protein